MMDPVSHDTMIPTRAGMATADQRACLSSSQWCFLSNGSSRNSLHVCSAMLVHIPVHTCGLLSLFDPPSIACWK